MYPRRSALTPKPNNAQTPTLSLRTELFLYTGWQKLCFCITSGITRLTAWGLLRGITLTASGSPDDQPAWRRACCHSEAEWGDVSHPSGSVRHPRWWPIWWPIVGVAPGRQQSQRLLGESAHLVPNAAGYVVEACEGYLMASPSVAGRCRMTSFALLAASRRGSR